MQSYSIPFLEKKLAKIALEDLTERYGFCDPASSKTRIKGTRARSAVILLGVDDLFRIFVLHAWAGRIAANNLRDKIIEVVDQFKPRRFGIEANAMQSLFADLVRDAASALKGQRLPLTPVQQPTRIDKDFRIRTALQPIIADGRLFLQPDQYELKEELKGFPMTFKKDLVDALASAITLIPKRRRKQLKRQSTEALAEYLRDSGAPAWYIERRIREEAGSYAEK